MTAYPAPAKLNLFLHLIGRRPDGYHLLQTVFRLLDYGDTVHLDVRADGNIRRIGALPGVPEGRDLCLRAARLLQEHTGCRLGVDIALEKRIPMGGGLGGGSSDAATVLLALNQRWGLHLPRLQLQTLALQLGADVPVFVFGQNAWAEGVGERLAAMALPPAWYVVLMPDVAISTAEVFASRELTRDAIPAKMAAFFKGFGHNDLQAVACRQYPAVAEALAWLSAFGDARMSGSGASVFIELESEVAADRVLALKPRHLKGFMARGLEQHPLHEFAA